MLFDEIQKGSDIVKEDFKNSISVDSKSIKIKDLQYCSNLLALATILYMIESRNDGAYHNDLTYAAITYRENGGTVEIEPNTKAPIVQINMTKPFYADVDPAAKTTSTRYTGPSSLQASLRKMGLVERMYKYKARDIFETLPGLPWWMQYWVSETHKIPTGSYYPDTIIKELKKGHFKIVPRSKFNTAYYHAYFAGNPALANYYYFWGDTGAKWLGSSVYEHDVLGKFDKFKWAYNLAPAKVDGIPRIQDKRWKNVDEQDQSWIAYLAERYNPEGVKNYPSYSNLAKNWILWLADTNVDGIPNFCTYFDHGLVRRENAVTQPFEGDAFAQLLKTVLSNIVSDDTFNLDGLDLEVIESHGPKKIDYLPFIFLESFPGDEI